MIQHLPGKGRNQGRMGSLLIEMDNGIRFRLGGGFKDAERENPPAPGTRIVFKHYGYTKTNKTKIRKIPARSMFISLNLLMPLVNPL